MINVVIIGAGRMGAIHAANISAMSDYNLVAIADIKLEFAQSIAEKYKCRAVEIAESFKLDNIDAVVIASPGDTHADFIERASNAGLAIFCEKPVDVSIERINKLIDVIEKNNSKVMIGFQRRFDPNFSKMKEDIQAGVIGDVEMINIFSKDPAPPTIEYVIHSGGMFRDSMIHDFDMVNFILGEKIAELYAVGSSLVDKRIGKAGDVDSGGAIIKTTSGKIAQITLSRRAVYGYDQRVEVHGSKGLLKVDNVRENTVELANEKGGTKAATVYFFLERYKEAYKIEMDEFAKVIIDNIAPRSTIYDGLKAQIMADAATNSCKTGQIIKFD